MNIKAPTPLDYRQNTSARIDADPVFRRARAVDHAFFKANPIAPEFFREMIPGEFVQNRLPLAEPTEDLRFAVLVRAFLDPNTREVIMRLREWHVVSSSVALEWYACDKSQGHES